MTAIRAALLALSGLLVAISAGCGLPGSAPEPGSARAHVEALGRALVEADATALVRLVDDPRYDVSTALLTVEVLGHGALAGEDVDIERTDSDLDSIRYALRTPAEEPRPWLEPELRRSGDFVGLPLPTVTLFGPGVTSVSIDGDEVGVDPLPDEGQTFYLPPGEYEVGVGGADRYVDHGPTQHLDTRQVGADLEFSGQLNAAGRARVDAAVRSFVTRCTEPIRGSRPANCPARKAFVGGLDSSQWSLASYPRTVIEADRTGWVVSTPNPPLARMRGVLRDRETGTSEAVTDRVPFAVSGRVSVRGEELVIEVPGY